MSSPQIAAIDSVEPCPAPEPALPGPPSTSPPSPTASLPSVAIAPIPNLSSMLITPATYSGVHVLQQADANGEPVMRRAKDDYINATQVLRAAGFPKTQRTKILERDISGGVHEKGTWVPLETAIRLARKHNVNELLTPLFSYTLEAGPRSEIFKSMGKFAKPYRIPRGPKPGPGEIQTGARGATSRFANAFGDTDSDDDSDMIQNFGDSDEDEYPGGNGEPTKGSKDVPPKNGMMSYDSSATDGNDDPVSRRESRKQRSSRLSTPQPLSFLTANTSNNDSASTDNEDSNNRFQKRHQSATSASQPPQANATSADPPVPVKRGPGRPKGSKNRTNSSSPGASVFSTFNSRRGETPENLTKRAAANAAIAAIAGESHLQSNGLYRVGGRGRGRGSVGPSSTGSGTRIPQTPDRSFSETTNGAVGAGSTNLSNAMDRNFSRKQAIERDTAELMDPYKVLEFGVDLSDSDSCDGEDMSNNQNRKAIDCATGRTDSEFLAPGMFTGQTGYKRKGNTLLRGVRPKKPKPVSQKAHTTGKLTQCESCGNLTTFKWKQNYPIGGKYGMLLCNLCGLRNCLKRNSDNVQDDEDDSASESSNPLSRWTIIGDLEFDGWSDSAETIALKAKLADIEIGCSKLIRLLNAVQREDAGVDRALRRTIIACRRVKKSTMRLFPSVSFGEGEDADKPDSKYISESIDIDEDRADWGKETAENFISAVLTRAGNRSISFSA
ncbi:hypothetical protein HDU84_004459 [Entophlyctis sp. JEL0112]|nr:hypothetical protein HDU84_004459 [Entophlyctis sp. JEL0112]